MTYYVRDGRLEKKRKGKDIAGPISAPYEMNKQIHYDNNEYAGGGYRNAELFGVSDKKKPRIYREYVNSQYKTKGKTGMRGKSKELTPSGGEKTTTISMYNPKKEAFYEKADNLKKKKKK